jgi:hypothetical protein
MRVPLWAAHSTNRPTHHRPPILMVADRRMQPGLQGAPEPIKEGLEVAELTALVLDISQQEHGVWIQGRCQTGHAVITAGGIRSVLTIADISNGDHRDTRGGLRRRSGSVLAHGRIRGPAPGIEGRSGDKRGLLGQSVDQGAHAPADPTDKTQDTSQPHTGHFSTPQSCNLPVVGQLTSALDCAVFGEESTDHHSAGVSRRHETDPSHGSDERRSAWTPSDPRLLTVRHVRPVREQRFVQDAETPASCCLSVLPRRWKAIGSPLPVRLARSSHSSLSQRTRPLGHVS